MLTTIIDDALVDSIFERAAHLDAGGLAPPESFHEFKMRVWGLRYKSSLHISFIDEIIERALYLAEHDRDNPRRMFLVSVPPRHSKTFNFCEAFPGYFLGRNPNRQIVTVSYAARKAAEASYSVRRIISSDVFKSMYDVKLSGDMHSRDRWLLAAPNTGGMVAAGIGGTTGYGGSIVICDDPHANLEDARSETMRDKVWDSFVTDFLTRKEDKPVVIVVQTRWHPDDVIGRILNNHKAFPPESYEYLRLPALAEHDDPLGREEGEPLWPEEFNKRELLAQRAAMGAINFGALYQQDPRLASGGIFDPEWIINRGGVEPQRRFYERVIVAVDPAVTSNKDSDETGIIVVARDVDQNCWVLEDASLRATPQQWATRIVKMYHKWDADNVVVEVNQGGDLVKTTIHSVDSMVPVTNVRATMGKLLRFEPVAALYEQRRVFHLHEFPDLVMQMVYWAPGDTDSPDRLDACCYGITELMLKGGMAPGISEFDGLWGKEEIGWGVDSSPDMIDSNSSESEFYGY